MNGTYGYRGLLRAMKLLATGNPVLRDECCDLVKGMMEQTPPLCPKEEGQRFLDSMRASLTSLTSLTGPGGPGGAPQGSVQGTDHLIHELITGRYRRTVE